MLGWGLPIGVCLDFLVRVLGSHGRFMQVIREY